MSSSSPPMDQHTDRRAQMERIARVFMMPSSQSLPVDEIGSSVSWSVFACLRWLVLVLYPESRSIYTVVHMFLSDQTHAMRQPSDWLGNQISTLLPALVMKAPTNAHAPPGTESQNSEQRAASIPDIRHGMACKPLHVCAERLLSFMVERETEPSSHLQGSDLFSHT